MCGRYTSTSAPADLAKVFAVDDVKVDELPLRYNVAPTQDVYAVAERRPTEDGESPRRQLGAFRWGLIPYWAKDPSAGNKMINARAEGIETKNAYKGALTRRRCIIPADAFYEWQVRDGDAKGKAKKKNKLPYIIRHKDGSPLAFAGLWEFWRPKGQPDAEPIRSCVIITTAANDLVAPIHDRMPVILPAAAWDTWLDPGVTDLAAIQGLLVPSASRDLEAYPVSTRVNDVANEGPELVEPLPPPPGFGAGPSELQLAPSLDDRPVAEHLQVGGVGRDPVEHPQL